MHHIQELARHAGHADIIRELTDGQVGIGPALSNVAELDASTWAEYRAKLRGIAESFPA